jgi:hypothetical protein
VISQPVIFGLLTKTSGVKSLNFKFQKSSFFHFFDISPHGKKLFSWVGIPKRALWRKTLHLFYSSMGPIIAVPHGKKLFIFLTARLWRKTLVAMGTIKAMAHGTFNIFY